MHVLFDAAVVASSREWVCIRVASYEDPAETEFLRAAYNAGLGELEEIFHVLPGRLENTTFGLFAPDGETPLSCVVRDPRMALDTIRVRGVDAGGSGTLTQRFARLLSTLADDYAPVAEPGTLPTSLDLRRALNVAACDDQPLVVAVASSAETRDVLEGRLARLAWSEPFVGRLQYAVVDGAPHEQGGDREVLAAIEGVPAEPCVLVVEPGTFGTDGRVLAHLSADEATDAALAETLHAGLRRYDRVELSREEHAAAGARAGASWRRGVPKESSALFSRRRRQEGAR